LSPWYSSERFGNKVYPLCPLPFPLNDLLDYRYMFSQTRRALADFDNQHDFERMAADVLNALGYSDVEPMAPGGGADGGRDIRFRDGDSPGIAFVTLDKKLKEKFKRDLSKQGDAEGLIALFCDSDVTPSMKLAFTKD